MQINQIIQIGAWIIALIELILGFYIFLLNTQSKSNQHVSILLFLFSINTFAQGLLFTSIDFDLLNYVLLALAITTPAIQPGLLLVAVVLIKPEWLKGQRKWVWWIVYGLVALPFLFSISDFYFGTSIWFTRLQAQAYDGGFVSLQTYTQGFLGIYLRIIFIYLSTIITLIPLFYFVFGDKTISKNTRRLAIILLVTQLSAIILNFILSISIANYYVLLITSIIFAGGYTYGAFSQLISERHLQRGRLQVRLTSLILAITIPILVALSAFVVTQAGEIISQNAINRLEDNNKIISSTVEDWYEFNNKALSALVNMPAIVSMDAQTQKPVLENIAASYPNMYLVSTIDLSGMNVARSDDAELTYYGDRGYFQQVLEGAVTAQETLIGRTSGQPALVVAKPIKDGNGTLIGVGFYASTLETISEAVQITDINFTGEALVVNESNQLIAHPNPQFTSNELRDFSQNPAVSSLRQNPINHLVTYQDDEGITWYAYSQKLENGWGVIVQQREPDFLIALSTFRTAVVVFILIGVVLLGILTTLAIRQAIQPINALTETAAAITEGDLSRIAPIESEDEIGVLALSFNQMTQQLLELIGNLERRVKERTMDLEQRSELLIAAAEVGRVASSVLDVDSLIKQVVNVIRDKFGMYYVGLFLVDEAREWAYLRAGTGAQGAALIERDHRIRIGQGVIGWSIANAKPRVSLDVERDAVRIETPELLQTRSEVAIPLRARGQVIGAITIQDVNPDTFNDVSLLTFQTMADLVSVAIDNARLYSESVHALQTSRSVFGEMIQRSWQEQKAFGIRSSDKGTFEIEGDLVPHDQAGGNTLSIPIKVREAIIGELVTYKPSDSGAWQPDEINTIETIVEQLSSALESAQLYDETQRRAYFEQLTRQVSTRIRETLDLETVLRTATQQLRQSINLEEVEINLGPLPDEHI